MRTSVVPAARGARGGVDEAVGPVDEAAVDGLGGDQLVIFLSHMSELT